MKDIYLLASEGDKKAALGVYVSTVASAYDSVNSVINDEEKSCKIVEEIYSEVLVNFSGEEDFFVQINNSAREKTGAGEEFKPIVAINTRFAELETLSVPQPLKDFGKNMPEKLFGSDEPEKTESEEAEDTDELDNALLTGVALVDEKDGSLKQDEEGEQDGAEKPSESDEKEEEADPEEDVKEFGDVKLNDLTPEQKIADMLTAKPVVKDEEDEQAKKDEKKKIIITLSVFAAVIVIAVILVMVFSHNKNKQADISSQSNIGTTVKQVETTTKVYKEGDDETAFKDYTDGYLKLMYGEVSRERTVLYSNAMELGIADMNGVAYSRVLDFDKDGKKELLTINLNISGEGDLYTYAYSISAYKFKNLKVTPVFENQPLLNYKTFNKIDNYRLNNFKFFVRMFYVNGTPYFYCEANSGDCNKVVFLSYKDGKLTRGAEFVHFAWSEDSYIDLKKREDGTFDPYFCVYKNYTVEKLSTVTADYFNILTEHGYTLSGNELACRKSTELINAFNEAFKETGLRLNGTREFSFDTNKRTDYLIYLKTEVEKDGNNWKIVSGIVK